MAWDSVYGRELWKSDGTEAGTVMVKDINTGSGDSTPQRLTSMNGALFFRADDGAHGVELCKTWGQVSTLDEESISTFKQAH